MVDTYRTGSSQSDMGGQSRPYGSAAQSRAAWPDYADESHDYDTQSDRHARRNIRTGLALEDSIVLLGIVLGGVGGYLVASSVRTDQSNRSSGRFFGRSHQDRSSARRGGMRSSGSVERDETTDLIASSKVEGTAVYNRQGEKLGEVYNFMVGKRSGQVAYAVMSFGGFLGIGQKYHALPWTVLTYDTDKKGYVIDADKDRLMGAPSYGAGEEPFSSPDYGRQVRDYWSSTGM